MEETLRWGWSYHASKREIERMRKNMKKVPIIQEKAEIYHQYQDKEAELFIDNSLINTKEDSVHTEITENSNETQKKIWLRKRLIYKIKSLLFKRFYGN